MGKEKLVLKEGENGMGGRMLSRNIGLSKAERLKSNWIREAAFGMPSTGISWMANSFHFLKGLSTVQTIIRSQV